MVYIIITGVEKRQEKSAVAPSPVSITLPVWSLHPITTPHTHLSSVPSRLPPTPGPVELRVRTCLVEKPGESLGLGRNSVWGSRPFPDSEGAESGEQGLLSDPPSVLRGHLDQVEALPSSWKHWFCLFLSLLFIRYTFLGFIPPCLRFYMAWKKTTGSFNYLKLNIFNGLSGLII